MLQHPRKRKQRDTVAKSRPRTTAWELADRHHDQATRKPSRPNPNKPKPRFKDHFVRLIYFIYNSRYATADQVQARFPKLFPSDRTCRRHLKELCDLYYLSRTDVKSTGANWPHVFFCNPKGTQLLREQLNLKLKNAREEGKSLQSIEHELFLTEFDLSCYQTIGLTPNQSICYHERRYMQQDKRLKYTPPPPSDKPNQEMAEQPLVPDAGFMLKVSQKNQQAFLQYFVELDNGTEGASVVLNKFKKYLYWASQGGQQYLINLYHKHGSSNPKATFRLLIIARRRGLTGTDQHRLADLYAQTLDPAIPKGLRHRMYFVTVAKLHQHQHDTPPLKAAMWYAGKDAADWCQPYQDLVESLGNKSSHQTYQQKRQFVLDHLALQPTHPIFPIPQLQTTKQESHP